MKTYFLLLSLFLLQLIACKKDENTKLLSGIYNGTFQRESVWADTDTAIITITFSSNTWIGTSDKTKYPALCNGTYSINNSTINFVNDCPWTTEFDWSLILSGKYKLTIDGKNVEFYKDDSPSYIDRYKLSKQ